MSRSYLVHPTCSRSEFFQWSTSGCWRMDSLPRGVWRPFLQVRTPCVDHLVSRFQNKQNKLFSRGRDPLAMFVDALMTLWDQLNLFYVFPLPKPLPRLLQGIERKGIPGISFHCTGSGICSTWTSSNSWWALPDRLDLLSQGLFYHPTLVRFDSLKVKAQVLRHKNLSYVLENSCLAKCTGTCRKHIYNGARLGNFIPESTPWDVF